MHNNIFKKCMGSLYFIIYCILYFVSLCGNSELPGKCDLNKMESFNNCIDDFFFFLLKLFLV